MNSVEAINVLRNSLRTNLPDPYTYAGATARDGSTYIFSDEPVSVSRYPIIQLKKLENPTEILNIGYTYTERERLIVNIWFSSKNGFKATISGTEYTNAQLVEYYLGLIKRTLKAQAAVLHTAGVIGYHHLNTTPPAYDDATQLYYGCVTIQVEYYVI